MHLEEQETKEAVRNKEAEGKRVNVFLQSVFYLLEGDWQWDMATQAIFCSDVLFSAESDFIGTRAIFHPDDVPAVGALLSTKQYIAQLQFRIVTTYGEVKTLRGNNLVVVKGAPVNWPQKAIETAAGLVRQRAEHQHLQLVKEIDDRTSRFSKAGTWYYNATTHQTWYSDFVYQLHGLPAQCLNAHLHMFQQFVHPEDKVLVSEYTGRAFLERTPLHMDYRIVASGREKWISFKTQWFFTAQGEEILGGHFQDVTEQKQNERETENYKSLVQFQRQQALFDEQQLNLGHWSINLLTRKTTCSDQYYRIYGLKPQSIAPTLNAFLNFVHPDDQEKVAASFKQIINEHSVTDIEYRIIRSDGKQRHILQKAKLLTMGGEMVASGIAQDISVQRLLEKKVANQAEMLQLRSLLEQQSNDQANLITWTMDLAEQQIVWSDSFYKLIDHFKMQHAIVSEKTLFSLVHPQEQKAFKDQWYLALQQKQAAAFDVRFLVRGVLHFMKASFNLYQHNDKDYFIGTLLNTTANQVLQQQLSQRVQLAECLSENTLDRMIITDLQNTILLWNRACEQFYGIRKAEAIGQNFFDVFPQRRNEAERQLFSRVQKGEKVVLESRPSVNGKDYHTLYLLPLYHEGAVYGILHIVHDVTREVELRNSLHNRLQLIEGLVQSSVDRIIALDRNLNYLYWNKRAEDYYGLAKEEVLGKNILEVFPAMVSDPSYGQIRKALHGETVYLPVNPETKTYFETYLIPVKDDKGEVASLLWTSRDLSEEWRLQQEQQQAQQLLQQEHRRLKEAQAIGRIGSFEWDAVTGTIYWSDEMYRLHGLEPQSDTITFERVFSFMLPNERDIYREQLQHLQQEAGSLSMVHRLVRNDGTTLLVSRQLKSTADDEGQVIFISGTLQDITDQVRRQEALQRSNELLRETESVALTGSCEVDLSDMSFRFSDGMYRIFGEEPQSFVPTMEWIDSRSHPDDMPIVKMILQEAANSRQANPYSRRIYRKDGELRTVECSGQIKTGTDGSNRFLALVQDITERRKAEEELLQSKELIEEITLTTPDLITIHDASNQIIYSNNNEFWKGFFDQEYMCKMQDSQRAGAMVHPDDLEKAMTFLKERRLLAGDKVLAVELRMKTGRWIRIRSKVFKRDATGAALQVISFTSDVSDAKQAETELQKNLAILQQAEDLAQIGSWEYNFALGTFSWSEGLYRLFNLPPGTKVSPETYLQFAAEADRSIAKRIIKTLTKNHQSFEETLRIKRADGERLLKVRGSVVADEYGKPQRMVGVDVDMTNIEAAEKRLKESEHWLRQTALASPDAITVYDLRKKFPVYLNNCLAEWLNMTSEDLINLGISGRLELFHPDDRLRLLHFQEKLKAASEGQVLTLEYRLQKKDGSLLWIRNRSKIFQQDAAGRVTHVLSVLQDVTEEKAAERILTSLNASLEKKNQELEQKNEEITSFAFVASHDLKEPLRKIHTLSDWLLTRETALSEDGKQGLQKLNGAVRRLDLLINDILALTKVHAANKQFKTVDLNRLLQQVQQEMHGVIQQANAVIDVAPLPKITGEVNQLFFLFKSVVGNAIKFQPKDNQPRLHVWAETDNAYLKICISDNGLGIAPEFHKKVFEVFRRLHSREEYEGTGMGLAICKKIMEKHSGKMSVVSERGNGATFVCWFPLALSTTEETS